MFCILILVALVTNVVSQDIIGVNYSFDVDFFWNFNNKTCENRNRWLLVDYKEVGVDPPNEEATSAILATANSCTSSFQLVFFPGSILELYVFTKLGSGNSGIIVLVVNEDNKPIQKYSYSRSNKDYVDGWCVLTIPIQNNAKGYINLNGYSSHDEIILIDSFKYTLNATIEQVDEDEDERTFLIVNHRGEEISDKGSEDIESNDGEFFDDAGSGDGVSDNDIVEPRLAPWSITLIVIGALTFLALIAVGSYHLGKLKGLKEYPAFTEEGEPPRVLRIPRVTGTTGSSVFSRWEF